MKVAIVACAGCNELDVFANLHIINRASRVRPEPVLKAELACVSPTLHTMYGVQLTGLAPLSSTRDADAVIIGSGGTLDALADEAFMSGLRLDPARQLIASQCSGALVLARLGLLRGMPACTDALYRARLQAAGVTVLDRPFHAQGNVATAGGCLSAAHLATWIIWRLLGASVAEQTLASVAPVGQEQAFVSQVMSEVQRAG